MIQLRRSDMLIAWIWPQILQLRRSDMLIAKKYRIRYSSAGAAPKSSNYMACVLCRSSGVDKCWYPWIPINLSPLWGFLESLLTLKHWYDEMLCQSYTTQFAHHHTPMFKGGYGWTEDPKERHVNRKLEQSIIQSSGGAAPKSSNLMAYVLCHSSGVDKMLIPMDSY